LSVQSPPPVDVRPSDGAGQEQYQEHGRTACPSSSETNKRRVMDVQEVKSAQDQDRRDRNTKACQLFRELYIHTYIHTNLYSTKIVKRI